MDISVIDASKINMVEGIHIGSHQAPTKIVEFINVRCPYSKKWFDQSFILLSQAVEEGKVERIIKLLDKDKESLQSGNRMHKYIPEYPSDDVLKTLSMIFETQNKWGSFSTLSDVELFAQKNLGLKLQSDDGTRNKIMIEAQEANIHYVPTVITGDVIFDETIAIDSLKKLLD